MAKKTPLNATRQFSRGRVGRGQVQPATAPELPVSQNPPSPPPPPNSKTSS